MLDPDRLSRQGGLRLPWDYDYHAIGANKARETWHLVRHAGLLARHAYWLSRDRVKPPLMVLAAVVAILALLVLRLVWPRGFRAFLDD